MTLDCDTCLGTGIGQFGDPNTSHCQTCGGRGFFRHAYSDECECDGCEEERFDRATKALPTNTTEEI